MTSSVPRRGKGCRRAARWAWRAVPFTREEKGRASPPVPNPNPLLGPRASRAPARVPARACNPTPHPAPSPALGPRARLLLPPPIPGPRDCGPKLLELKLTCLPETKEGDSLPCFVPCHVFTDVKLTSSLSFDFVLPTRPNSLPGPAPEVEVGFCVGWVFLLSGISRWKVIALFSAFPRLHHALGLGNKLLTSAPSSVDKQQGQRRPYLTALNMKCAHRTARAPS
jgi:hypothetical protein